MRLEALSLGGRHRVDMAFLGERPRAHLSYVLRHCAHDLIAAVSERVVLTLGGLYPGGRSAFGATYQLATVAATGRASRVSRPYLRSRVYSCIREIPSFRDACILLPLVSPITRSMVRRSSMSSSVPSTGTCCGADRSDRSAARIAPSSHRMVARSITLRSSRTLPGQSCWSRAAIASEVISTRRPAV